MSMRDRRGLPLFIALITLAVAAHLVIGTWTVLLAARWLDWTLAVLAVAALAVVHVIGLRRLARRRRANSALTDQG